MLHLLGLYDEYPDPRKLGPHPRPVRIFLAPVPDVPDLRGVQMRMPRRTGLPPTLMRDVLSANIAAWHLFRIWQVYESQKSQGVAPVWRGGRGRGPHPAGGGPGPGGGLR